MACHICKAPLAKGDRHFGCLLHRDCSRQAPCSFDLGEPADYWDEVESLIAAAKCLSPDRRSTRLAIKDQSSKGNVTEPPPMTPISNPVEKETVKKRSKKCDSNAKTATKSSKGTKSTGLPDQDRRTRDTKLSEKDIGTSSDRSSVTTPDPIPIPSAPTRQKSGSGSAREKSTTSSSSTSTEDTRGKSGTSTEPNISEQTSDPEHTSEFTGRPSGGIGFIPNFPGNNPYDYRGEGTYDHRGEGTFNNSSFTSDRSGRSSGWPNNDMSFSGRDYNPWCDQQPFRSQYNRPNMGRWHPMMSQWQSPRQSWSMPPPGPPNNWSSEWSNPPFQEYGPGNLGGGRSPVINSQPTFSLPHGASPPIVSEPTARMLSVPSRRRSLVASAPTGPLPDTDRPLSGDSSVRSPRVDPPIPSRDRVPTGDDLSLEDCMPLFTVDSHDSGSSVLESDAVPDSMRKRFSRDRLNPVLSAAAKAAGSEFVKDEVRQSSLLFGNTSMRRGGVDPISQMPPDVYNFQDDVRSFKGTLGNSSFFNKLFRVPEEDYTQLFKTPEVDADTLAFIKPQVKASPSNYFSSTEKFLCNIDRELRILSRVSAFQLLILNALSIQLSDGCADGEERDSPDGPFAMAKLASDIASQQVQHSMRISHHTLSLRRDNVYAGVVGKYKDDLVSRLKEIDLNGEYLFAGDFSSKVKEVAKRVQREYTVSKGLQSTQSKSSTRDRSVTKGSSKSASSYGNSRNHPYANRGRGNASSDRSFSSNRSNNSSNQRGNQRNNNNNNRGQSRGRGRGRPGSRF